MTINTILAGVDTTAEGMLAGSTAWNLARRTEAHCHLIHATFDTATVAWLPPTIDAQEYMAQMVAGAREGLEDKLAGYLPEEAIKQIGVRVGNPAVVLDEAAQELGADLIVLGGRRRSAVSRWLEGSTTKHLVRRGDAPVLVAMPPEAPYQRVLTAVDMSSMMEPTIRWARDIAALYGAQVKVVHAVEPLPYDYAGVIHQPDAYFEEAKEEFRTQLAALDADDLEYDVVQGPGVRTIARQIRRWNADLVVVGSHGKGLVDRVLLGSTTSRLINELPASLLIVPPGQRKTDTADAELVAGEAAR